MDDATAARNRALITNSFRSPARAASTDLAVPALAPSPAPLPRMAALADAACTFQSEMKAVGSGPAGRSGAPAAGAASANDQKGAAGANDQKGHALASDLGAQGRSAARGEAGGMVASRPAAASASSGGTAVEAETVQRTVGASLPPPRPRGTPPPPPRGTPRARPSLVNEALPSPVTLGKYNPLPPL